MYIPDIFFSRVLVTAIPFFFTELFYERDCDFYLLYIEYIFILWELLRELAKEGMLL